MAKKATETTTKAKSSKKLQDTDTPKATKAPKAKKDTVKKTPKNEVEKPIKKVSTKAEQQSESLDLTVENSLRLLYELQKVMSKIDEIKILRGDLPLEVQDLEDEITGLTTRVDRYNTDIQDIKRKISESHNSIEQAKINVEKKTEQQNNVVNNREYEILSKALENLNLDIQLFEKIIGDSTKLMAEKVAESQEIQAIIDDKKEELLQKQSELQQIILETKKDEEELREKAKKNETIIEARLLLAFKRIRKNARNGLAVVPVERNSCSGCFNKIPPQRQLDIRQRKKIIVCENCGRILVDYELSEE